MTSSEAAADWLPEGWIVDSRVLKTGRKTRCYTNSETGKSFSFKHEVLRYVERESIFKRNLQLTNTDSQTESDDADEVDELEERATEFPEWLPHGWNMYVTTRRTGLVKIYVDPDGRKFYSKPEMFGWSSSSVVNQTSKSKPKKYNKTNMKPFSAKEVVYEKYVDEDLPQGWIKEIKISKDGDRTRRDPYYTDPVKGYVFRSKKDVFRYLETGEISKHAMLPKKRGVEKSTNGEASPSPGAKQQKLEAAATILQLFEGAGEGEGAGSSGMSNIPVPEVEAPKQGQSDMVAAEYESSKQGQNERVAAEDKAPLTELEAPKQGQDNGVAAEVRLVIPQTSQVLENNVEKENVAVETKITAEGTKTNHVSPGESHVAAHAIDTLPEKITPNSGLETNSEVVVGTMSNNSRNEKDHNLVLPSSRWFPGVKLAFEADEASTEQALPKIDMKGKATQQLNTDIGMNLGFDGITDIKTQSYNCNEPLGDQVILVNQPKLKTSTIVDENSDTPTLVFYENPSLDSCLDFPFDTLANPSADAEPIDTLSIMQEENSHETIRKGGNIGEGFMANNKEFMLPTHSSKQLSEVKPNLVINSIFGEETLRANRGVEVDEASQYYGTYPSSRNAHYSSLNMNTLSHVGQTVPAMKPEMLEYLKMNNKPIQPQPSFPFGFSSSVPCLGFAHRTPTDAIHMGSNTPIQSPFQPKVGTSSAQSGGSNLSLPVFGVPYAPKSDFSSGFDRYEKQPAGRQQVPLNPTCLHPPNASFQNYYGMDTQNYYFDGTNAIHRMSQNGNSQSGRGSK